MLKQRLLAAAVLIPAAILWGLWAPWTVFVGLAAGVVMLGAWEWGGLAEIRTFWGRITLLIITAGALGGLAVALTSSYFQRDLLWAIVGMWTVLGLGLFLGHSVPSVLRGLEGILILTSTWWVLAYIRGFPGGGGLIISLLAMVISADSAAYFAGKIFGKHRLAPRISPGKTWEGLVAGLLGGAIAGILSSLWMKTPVWPIMILGIIVAAASVVGDLKESQLKRQAGMKDSGRLIPGHGGLLDRIDGLLAAAPVFAMGLDLVRIGR